MADNNNDMEKTQQSAGQIAKAGFRMIRTIILNPAVIIFVIIIAALIILAGAAYQLKLIDGKEDTDNAKNAPGAARNYMNSAEVGEKGDITVEKSANEFWQQLDKDNNRALEYLDTPEELAKLLSASMATEYLDTRENPDEPIDWKEAFKLIEKSKAIAGTNSSSSGGTGGSLTGNQLEIYKVLSAGVDYNGTHINGLGDVQIAGILGNIVRETHTNPATDTGVYRGLIQWSGNRFSGLESYATSKGKPWTDIVTQSEYILIELFSSSGTRWGSEETKQMFLNATNPHDATKFFLVGTEFEEPYTDARYAELKERYCIYYPDGDGEGGNGGSKKYNSDGSYRGWEFKEGYDAADEAYAKMGGTPNVAPPSGSNTDLEDSTSEKGAKVQGIVKLKRRIEDDKTITMTYVSPSKFQEYISEYNSTGSEEAKQEAMSHFTIEKQGGTSFGGTANFKTYNLTEEQIRAIADLCYGEQGEAGLAGIAAEASLCANILEVQSHYRNKFGSDIYAFISNSDSDHWFSGKTRGKMGTGVASAEAVDVVRKVLVEGKRTLPGYVDEHDGFFDLTSATNDGAAFNVRDRSQYKQNVTRIRNRYMKSGDPSYTFYSFPGVDRGDPFGYTEEAAEQRQSIGEAYYDVNTWQVVNGSSTGTSSTPSSGGTGQGNFKNASEITPQQLVESATNVMKRARESLNTDVKTIYGDSWTSPVPCEEENYHGDYGSTPPAHGNRVKYISCDRLIARALYDLGFTDQKAVNPSWFEEHGFTKSENNTSDIGYGSILWFYKKNKTLKHTYIVCGKAGPNIQTYRLDAGSNDLIAKEQPTEEGWYTKGAGFYVFNIPGYGGGTTGPIPSGDGTGALHSAKGEEIVRYARQFVGNPYVWGGNSLTDGCDCSHFVYNVLKNCGVYDGEYLTSREWINVGENVGTGESLEEDLKQAVAGDIIIWNGHIGIYDGNGKMVEAKGAQWGITDTYAPSSGHPYLGIRRFTNDVATVSNSAGTGDSTVKYVAKIATWHQTQEILESNDSDVAEYDRTSYSMETETIDYKKYVSKYAMPFNYLWAMMTISQDKDFVLDLADTVLNSKIEITIRDDVTTSTSVRTENYTKEVTYTVTNKIVEKGRTIMTEEIPYTETIECYKTYTTIKKDDKIDTKLSLADAWCAYYEVDYNSEKREKKEEISSSDEQSLDDTEEVRGDENSEDVQEYKKKVIEENNDKNKKSEPGGEQTVTTVGKSTKETKRTTKTETVTEKYEYSSTETKVKYNDREPNFASLLKANYNARSSILSGEEWLYKILASNDDTKNMIDITKYFIYKATSSDHGLTKFDFSNYDPERFLEVVDDLPGETDEEKIWIALKSQGYNDYIIAGIMGNLSVETNLRYNNLEDKYEAKLGADNQYTAKVNVGLKEDGKGYTKKDFINDKAGYGLFKWSSKEDKEGLYDYIKKNDKYIDDLKLQLEYFISEVKENGPAADYAKEKKEGHIERGNAIVTREEWEKSSTLIDATVSFMQFYFGVSKSSSTVEDRLEAAEYYYNKLKNLAIPTSSNFANGDFLQVAKEVWAEVCSKFTIYGGTSIPPSGTTIDCSSYVSWVLYKYGYTEFGGEQHCTDAFYLTDWASKYGWTEIPLDAGQNPYDQLQPGDLIVRVDPGANKYGENYKGHITLVVEKKDGKILCYDCGSSSNWRGNPGNPVDKSYMLTNGRIGKVIRVTPPKK